jgi:hypothetical protein
MLFTTKNTCMLCKRQWELLRCIRVNMDRRNVFYLKLWTEKGVNSKWEQVLSLCKDQLLAETLRQGHLQKGRIRRRSFLQITSPLRYSLRIGRSHLISLRDQGRQTRVWNHHQDVEIQKDLSPLLLTTSLPLMQGLWRRPLQRTLMT